MLRTRKTIPAHFSVVERMEDALGYLAKQSYDIVLLDLHLPDAGGLSPLDCIVSNWTGPVIVLSGNSNEDVGIAAIERGAMDYLVKGTFSSMQLAELLGPRIPGLKILFMSGYTSSVIAAHGVLDEGINFIQKPFSQKDLAEKVYAVLE